MRSAVLCRSLNNSIWFRFDWNVQHYFVSIRKTFTDVFVALTELRKKITTHFVPQKTRKKLFSHEKATQNLLSLHKKTTQNFTCTWPEHSTIVSSWMLKCNASAVVVVVAEKCEYHRTCCDYLVVAACQDCSAWNERKKNSNIFISWS